MALLGAMLTRADMKELGSTNNNSADGEYDAKRDSALSYDVAIAEMRRRKEWRDKLTAAKRVEFIGNCMMIQGDCLDVIPQIGKVDAVVTDVPYGISRQSNGLRRLDYGEWDNETATPVTLQAMTLIADVPSVIAWCDWRQLSDIAAALPNRSERPLTWAKPNPPVLNGQNLFLSSTEHAFYGKMSGAWFSGGCLKSYWVGPPPADRQHPTQKPIWLMKTCVSATVKVGDVCLDPFMGSGTTGVACVKTGRHFIGIELDPDYFDIACRRVREAYAQPDLLIDAPKEAPQVQGAFEL